MATEPEPFFQFEVLFGTGRTNLTDLPADDLRRFEGEMNQAMFTAGVEALRNPGQMPNPHINALMSLFYNLVANRITQVFQTDRVDSVHFWCEKTKGQSTASVLVPGNYHTLATEDPYMQLGALVSTGSKARDFYNNKFEDGRAMVLRSRAYEAEYLNAVIKKGLPNFSPNDYQKGVLEEFPNGLDSMPPELKYQSLPFVKPGDASRN